MGISKQCIQLVSEVDNYCKQFSKEECNDHYYNHQSNQLQNPINCVWKENTNICQAGDRCD